MTTIEGKKHGKGVRIAIVVSKFNYDVSKKLLKGAVDTLIRHGVEKTNMTVVYVPGGLEIPLTAQTLAGSGKYDGLIALGAVIKGGTSHYLYVSDNCLRGISNVSLTTGVPITSGVLTTDTVDQAFARASHASGLNRGVEAAEALLEMVDVLKKVR